MKTTTNSTIELTNSKGESVVTTLSSEQAIATLKTAKTGYAKILASKAAKGELTHDQLVWAHKFAMALQPVEAESDAMEIKPVWVKGKFTFDYALEGTRYMIKRVEGKYNLIDSETGDIIVCWSVLPNVKAKAEKLAGF